MPSEPIGYQIIRWRSERGSHPPGMAQNDVFGFDYVTAWVAHAFDRRDWCLIPVAAGDVPGANLRPDDAAAAAAAAAAYNAAQEPHATRLTRICDRLQELAEGDEQVQLDVDDLCFDAFGDGVASSLNNQGIHGQAEALAQADGYEDAADALQNVLDEYEPEPRPAENAEEEEAAP